MKKLILTLVASIGLMGIAPATSAFAATQNAGGDPSNTDTIIAADGMFTSNKFDPTPCKVDNQLVATIKNNEFGDGVDPDTDAGKQQIATDSGLKSFGDNGDGKNKVAGMLVDPAQGMTNAVLKNTVVVDCKKEFNFTTHLLKIGSPLNLTNVKPIMSIMGITQVIALAASTIIIVIYGIMFTTGFQRLDPIRFMIRLFFSMIAVYYLPYLLQDILNLNNVLAHNLSTMNIGYSDAMANAAGSSAIMVLFASFSVFISGLLGVMISTGAIPGAGQIILLVLAALAIVFLVLILKPIIKIIIWWYVRMLFIYLLAIIGPFFVIMIALPQTATYAKKWIMAFISETATQFFMMITIVMFASIWGNIDDFKAMTDIGMIGMFIMLYAMIMFLSEVPGLAKSFFGGVGNPGNDAIRNLSEGMTSFGTALMGAALTGGQSVMNKKASESLGDKKEGISTEFNRGGGNAQPPIGDGSGNTLNLQKHTSGGPQSSGNGNTINDPLNTQSQPQEHNLSGDTFGNESTSDEQANAGYYNAEGDFVPFQREENQNKNDWTILGSDGNVLSSGSEAEVPEKEGLVDLDGNPLFLNKDDDIPSETVPSSSDVISEDRNNNIEPQTETVDPSIDTSSVSGNETVTPMSSESSGGDSLPQIRSHTAQQLERGLKDAKINRNQAESIIANDLMTQNKNLSSSDAKNMASQIMDKEEAFAGKSWDSRFKEAEKINKKLDVIKKTDTTNLSFGGHQLKFGSSKHNKYDDRKNENQYEEEASQIFDQQEQSNRQKRERERLEQQNNRDEN